MTPPVASEQLAALGATNLLGELRVDPLRQRGQDGGGRWVNDAGVLPAATQERFPGPTEAPTLPTRCGIGFCAGAVLKNPLEPVPALNDPPPGIQPGNDASVTVGGLAQAGAARRTGSEQIPGLFPGLSAVRP
jgi:hypothetical protein